VTIFNLVHRACPWRSSRVGRRLHDGSLTFVFQPIVDLRDGRTVGFEGLTRDPDRAAEVLFQAAADEGALLELELHAIAAQLAAAIDLPGQLYLSVNASPSTITSTRFAEVFDGFPLDQLVVEINEREAIEDYGSVREALEQLRHGGMRLAVDDAGAGAASLHHLIELRPDIIKLDGGLIDAIERDAGQRAMARAIVAFAAETGADVVAECIESIGSAVALAALGIDHGQGFALGRPAPAGWSAVG
jgi:EAL domain-containing protein (putative c-di-GMP-specific phosphodiesterase class I)